MLTPSVSRTFGNPDSWVSGYAQERLNTPSSVKGNHNFIWPAIVPLTASDHYLRGVNGQQVRMDSGQTLAMRIDNAEEVNISESESHMGSDNVMWAWNKLRTGKRVVVSGSGVKTCHFHFEAGLLQFFPAFGDNGCVPGFCTVALPSLLQIGKEI